MLRVKCLIAILGNLCVLSRSLIVRRASPFISRSLLMSYEGQIPIQAIQASSHSEFRGDTDGVDDELEETGDMLPTWRDRIDTAIAMSRKVKGGNYVQIATIDERGFPRCRTLVFRGFLNVPLMTGATTTTETLKFIADARSEKMSQISANSMCEMVWWFSESSEQFRVSGELLPVSMSMSPDHALRLARLDQWKILSDTAREQFYWNSPGITYSGSPVVPAGGRSPEGELLDPPDSFVLLLLVPKAVKYLRLNDSLAIVDVRAEEGGAWISEKVNP